MVSRPVLERGFEVLEKLLGTLAMQGPRVANYRAEYCTRRRYEVHGTFTEIKWLGERRKLDIPGILNVGNEQNEKASPCLSLYCLESYKRRYSTPELCISSLMLATLISSYSYGWERKEGDYRG